MIFYTRSLRFQIFYGALLLAAVIALSFVLAWRAERDRQFDTVDAGLQARATQITGSLFRSDPPLEASEPAAALALPRHEIRFGSGEDGATPYYYIIWGHQTVRYRSESAPSTIAIPTLPRPPSEDGSFRVLDGRRERLHQTRKGFLVLVGRDITTELSAIRRYAIQLAILSGAILGAGLLYAYWVSRQAMRPIAEINQAAKRIADGALSERIATQDNRSELGQLCQVLNHTFDKLEHAYQRQTRFAADASHELRTPVAVILAEIQSAPKQSRSQAEYEECLAICEESATGMQSLLQRLMLLAKYDSAQVDLQIESVDLEALLLSLLPGFDAAAEAKSIDIQIELQCTKVPADRAQLSQVVSNLISNAIAYHHDTGGQVWIRSVEKAGDQVEISITDDGPGIAAQHLPHLFDRFYRCDVARQGEGEHSGLGLAICHEIIERHGGVIEVDSEMEKGTTFRVLLPKVPEIAQTLCSSA